MELLGTSLNTYLEAHCDPESEVLSHITRETYLKETMPHMLSGHYQGRLLAMISKLFAPKNILEIGTFTGYATLCLAEGLTKDGAIHTIDINPELEDRVRGYFDKSPYRDQIQYHIGDASYILKHLDVDFDLIFIDADKKNNWIYFDMMANKVKPGSLFLIDNVLWKGKVFADDPDKQTRQVLELNEKLTIDQRVEKLILPVRDGIFVLRKK